MTKEYPKIVATFHTQGEAEAFARGIQEGLEYFPSEKWIARTTYVFGLLTGEWRAEIEFHD
jgi:hypothetical protein